MAPPTATLHQTALLLCYLSTQQECSTCSVRQQSHHGHSLAAPVLAAASCTASTSVAALTAPGAVEAASVTAVKNASCPLQRCALSSHRVQTGSNQSCKPGKGAAASRLVSTQTRDRADDIDIVGERQHAVVLRWGEARAVTGVAGLASQHGLAQACVGGDRQEQKGADCTQLSALMAKEAAVSLLGACCAPWYLTTANQTTQLNIARSSFVVVVVDVVVASIGSKVVAGNANRHITSKRLHLPVPNY